MPNYDLSTATLGRVANQDVNALMIANQLVWEVPLTDGPYYLNDADNVTPSTHTDGTPNIATGLQYLFQSSGYVTGFQWYDGNAGAGNWILSVYPVTTANGADPESGATKLGSLTIASAGSGWRVSNLATPIAVSPGQVYTFSRYNSAGHYAFLANASFPGSHGAYTSADPVYLPGDNENISAVAAGWTGIRRSTFQIGSGDVNPTGNGSGAFYGIAPVFYKAL